ncbi:MAG: c-type cytochrome [Rhodothermales bacterium]|nr:c-type cytochrome [Rhodothermales bacterium]
MKLTLRQASQYLTFCLALIMLGTLAWSIAATTTAPAAEEADMLDEQILRGRLLVITHGCGDCHGGFGNPAAEGWLVGQTVEEQIFSIGPFKTYPRNLTPDNKTGLGRFSERQIFNALRYGLRPGETPDVEITSMTPGEGNFPANPKYLAPPMPWPVYRHMDDQELWDIAAYLKHGLQPATNQVPDSEGPPDFWASEYTPEKYGAYPPVAFPTARERKPE